MHMIALTLIVAVAACSATRATSETWDCAVLPSEQQVETDRQSGAKVIFVTTSPAADTNFYFHDPCLLSGNRLMLFRSDRFGGSEIMGCLLETGELIRLMRPKDPGVGRAVASVQGDRLYVIKKGGISEWKLDLATTPKTAARLTERRVLTLPAGARQQSQLSESCDGRLLAYAYDLGGEHFIGFCEAASGKVLEPAKVDFGAGHLQFHRHRPDVVSFCREYGSDWAPKDPSAPRHARIWTMNVATRQALPAFWQVPGELATHEHWWVNDQMTFVGAFNKEGDREDGHVKVLDFKTGEIRVVGPGAWIEGVTSRQLTEVNWWHASGSPDGRWVAADNFRGVIALFDAKTTRKHILTSGHRAKDTHPHVGWDLRGEFVQFTSDRRGNPDVCIAYIPKDW